MKKVATIGYGFNHNSIVYCEKNQIEVTEKSVQKDLEKLELNNTPTFEYYEPTKQELQDLPQKIKHRKKRKYHN